MFHNKLPVLVAPFTVTLFTFGIIADWTWKNLTLSGLLLTEVLCELLFISCLLTLYESL